MNKEKCKKYFLDNGLFVSDSQMDLLSSLVEETLKVNNLFNLTAIKDEESFWEKMVFDSAIPLFFESIENKSLIDVGTGAGFPGMVLRALTNNDITLLDSTKKKVDHLLDFASNHQLDINGVSQRVEEFAINNREKYDYATARAVAALNVLLELIIPVLKVGGIFIAYKGKGAIEEINNSKKAMKLLSCEIIKTETILLPESKEERTIIFIKKNDVTNTKYPRMYSQIKKKPL